jgi:hypothetical protein
LPGGGGIARDAPPPGCRITLTSVAPA